MIPVGGIVPYAAADPPDDPNYLICDGQYYEISSYRDLWQVIQYRFGRDQAGRFAVPDLKGRVVVGMGTGAGLSYRELASLGGLERIQLNIANLPAHHHRGTSEGANPAGYRVVDPNNRGGEIACAENHVTGWHGGAYVDRNPDQRFPLSYHTHHFVTNGGDGCIGQQVETLPPFIVLNYIIRARRQT